MPSSATLQTPSSPQIHNLPLDYFYSATLAPFYSALDISRLVTPEMQASFLKDLGSTDNKACGNALVLLGLLRAHVETVIPLALKVALDQSQNVRFRYCGIVALVNAGTPDLVPGILKCLNENDPLRINLLDTAGA